MGFQVQSNLIKHPAHCLSALHLGFNVNSVFGRGQEIYVSKKNLSGDLILVGNCSGPGDRNEI